jgi:putative PIN family toxin of toxin-antitoxin system
MRLVVDTNVFVSAALKNASYSGTVVCWLDRYGGLLKTAATQQEVVEVLRRPRIAPKIASAFLAHLETIFVAAEIVTITERLRECRDPKDDKFLELAIMAVPT